MKVGSLVRCVHWKDHVFGVVVGEWTHDISREEHLLVYWLTGLHTGDTDAIMKYELEVLCK